MMVRRAFAALALLPTAALAEPLIRFAPYAVVAEGITAGGEAVWLSLSREAGAWSETVVPFHEVSLDEDGDGVVEVVRDKEYVASKSIWLLADLTTGATAIGTPDEFDKPEGKDPLWDEADFGVFFDVRESLEVVVVRPKVGAWHGTLFDGSKSDADGLDDGVITILTSALEPIGKVAEPLEALLPGDVVLGIDPHTMQHYALPVVVKAEG